MHTVTDPLGPVLPGFGSSVDLLKLNNVQFKQEPCWSQLNDFFLPWSWLQIGHVVGNLVIWYVILVVAWSGGVQFFE